MNKSAMNKADAAQDRVDSLAEEFTERCRRGEHPSVQEYVDRCPEAAEQLRELLPSIALIEQLKPNRSSSSRGATDGKPPEQLGEYRIIREVGRGGMGIVYEAIQQSLGRRVALKVLPRTSLLDPKRLERFRIEAQAAARLHHPNIVPVFGLFESDGLHYYVMQLITGYGLDAVLHQLRGGGSDQATQVYRPSTLEFAGVDTKPAVAPGKNARPILIRTQPTAEALAGSYGSDRYWREVSRIGAQAAEALHYAHLQGTLHRDIKPANLMLDANGGLWVTDFGLAKLTAQDGLTADGDLLGTLQYMSPESLHGQYGPSSDVYSLGLTLYELLTLEPPYAETNPASLLRMVSEEEPVAPRRRNPKIPRDLETIVLKAIARDPAHRYRTAHLLAEDLARFLDDRPVEARRVSSPERLWRWGRRNRALAGSLSAAFASLALASIVGWWAYASTTQAYRGAEKKRVEAELATKRVEANMQLSLKALESIFVAIAPPERRGRRDGGPNGPPGSHGGPGQGRGGPGGKPGGKPRNPEGPPQAAEHDAAEKALLETVLTFYEQFAEQNNQNPNQSQGSSTPKLRLEAARAQRRAADIYERLDERDKSRAAFKKSAAMFESLIAKSPDNPEYARDLVDTYLEQALMLGDETGPDGAQTLFERARCVAEKLVAVSPNDEGYVSLLAHVHRQLGVWFQGHGDWDHANEEFQKAIELEDQPHGPGQGGGAGRKGSLAHSYEGLGRLFLSSNRRNDAQVAFEKAISILDDHHKLPPESERLLGELYGQLADLVDDSARKNELRRKAETFQARGPRGPRESFDDGPPGPRNGPPDPFEGLPDPFDGPREPFPGPPDRPRPPPMPPRP